MEPWVQAYRKEFGSDPEDDMAEHADEIAEWRQNWQAGYDAGEEWATSLVDGDAGAVEQAG